MELQQLRYFLAVADRLHFTEAAKLMNVVQPAISRQIRLLEKQVGVRLLERTNRSVRLTPAGRAFQKRALVAVELAEAATIEARLIDRGEAGTLRIGYMRNTELTILPWVLKELKLELPGAKFDLVHLGPTEQLDALRKGEVDMGLSSSVGVSIDGMMSKLLSRETLIAAMPEKHPLAKHRTIDLKWLAKEPLLLPPAWVPHSICQQVEDACIEAGFVPNVGQTVLNAQTAVCLVAWGVGIALVPETFRCVNVDGAVYRPFKKPIGKLEFYAIRRKGEGSAILNRSWAKLKTTETFQGNYRDQQGVPAETISS